jgi:hypothetical protein
MRMRRIPEQNVTSYNGVDRFTRRKHRHLNIRPSADIRSASIHIKPSRVYGRILSRSRQRHVTGRPANAVAVAAASAAAAAASAARPCRR